MAGDGEVQNLGDGEVQNPSSAAQVQTNEPSPFQFPLWQAQLVTTLVLKATILAAPSQRQPHVLPW